RPIDSFRGRTQHTMKADGIRHPLLLSIVTVGGNPAAERVDQRQSTDAGLTAPSGLVEHTSAAATGPVASEIVAQPACKTVPSEFSPTITAGPSFQENTMARVVRFHKTGGPEVLQIDEVDVPPPAKGEVQLNIKAIGLNRAESMYRSGQY